MSSSDPLKPDKPPGILRSLGQFFGHIVKAPASDPDAPDASHRADVDQSVLIKHQVQEESRSIPGGGGVVRLRRTIIEEIALAPDAPAAEDPSAPPGERD